MIFLFPNNLVLVVKSIDNSNDIALVLVLYSGCSLMGSLIMLSFGYWDHFDKELLTILGTVICT